MTNVVKFISYIKLEQKYHNYAITLNWKSSRAIIVRIHIKMSTLIGPTMRAKRKRFNWGAAKVAATRSLSSMRASAQWEGSRRDCGNQPERLIVPADKPSPVDRFNFIFFFLPTAHPTCMPITYSSLSSRMHLETFCHNEREWKEREREREFLRLLGRIKTT